MKLVSRGVFLRRLGGLATIGSVLLLALLVGCVSATSAGAAAVHHLFDARLSLTGGCSTDEADPVKDPWCPGPPAPSAQFENPNIAIDSFGDMYVSSHEEEATFTETGGRVDVFGPDGEFLTELPVEGARALAVDPKGNLYVNQFVVAGVRRVTLFRPTVYDPPAGEVSYEDPGEVIIEDVGGAEPCSPGNAAERVFLAIDPSTEHLFVSPGGCVAEWSSAAEGPTLLDSTIGSGKLTRSKSIAVDAAHNRIYVADVKDPDLPLEGLINVFELQAPHAYLGSLDGSETAEGRFLARFGTDTLAADEKTGNLIVSELTSAAKKAYEFGLGLDAGEELLYTYEYFGFKSNSAPLQIAVDNGVSSPNRGTVFIPTEASLPHTFAFVPSEEVEPEVESAAASGVTETEAVLGGVVNPGGGETTYRIEYTAGDSFEGAVVAGKGTLAAGTAGVKVSAPVVGLTPGSAYRFRVVAENAVGEGQLEGSFRTFATVSATGSCPNADLRTGFSENLPDCRAYELVTPPNTNGREPHGGGEDGLYFPSLLASPNGNLANFRIEGGALPGSEGTGSFAGDNYLSRRRAGGWTTELVGPTGTEAVAPKPGGFSPDQEHNFWQGDVNLAEGKPFNDFVRYPDGHSEPVGRGSLGVDHSAQALLIGNNGSHIIFSSSGRSEVRLEPDAPPAGIVTIFDRTADEVTHVVSLLPGNATPAQDAVYLGASLDGRGVAFKIGQETYLRQDDETTYDIGENVTFAGIAEGGGRIFYLKAGNLFAFDAATGLRIQFSKGGNTTPVIVSPDGSAAYFVSTDLLTGKRENPEGAVAEAGAQNLYLSREGELSFVGTVEPSDVKAPLGSSGVSVGLGTWVEALQAELPGVSTARTTTSGDVLLFEARAPLTGYDPSGDTEIYRYDSRAPSLACLSCNPTDGPPAGDATLQTRVKDAGGNPILALTVRIANLSASGDRAFFQSYDQLNLADGDGRQDVYEWEAAGVGSCAVPAGCVFLVSSGQSGEDDYLFAASENGNDAFFRSGDRLLGVDPSSTPSIYDARVGGGFPEEVASPPCEGEGCRNEPTPPPPLPPPATPALGESGNLSNVHCPKGKRKVRRHGKLRCVKKHHHHKHHRVTKGRAGR